MTRRLRALALAAVLAVSLAGCTAGSGTSESSPDIGVPVPATDGSTAGGDTAGGESGGVPGAAPGAAPDGSGGGGSAEDGVDRDVVTTGTITITVRNPAAAAEEAADLVESAGGRIEARVEQAPTPSDRGRATLTVRVPSAAFSAALEDLKDLGRVESVNLTAMDVTSRTQDLEARIRGLQTSVDRLLGLLTTSADTDALLKVEGALAERQTELESLQSERDSLADAVALTTVTVQLLSAGIAPDPEPDDFWAGVVTGFSGLLAALGVAAVGIGVALPWLVFLSAVGALLFLVLRLIRRRSPERRRATAEPAAPPAGGDAA
ncbi:DUF4349 domain-containing protein [Planctomonas deserti]|uniref:DUF4349 domain-containing protein n=1 Tax=Planctomonas deserti TaxID=2144185 RepID=UPI000D377B4A|nr:DUF4349 domain-containing protein [Planctomonas deserti]